VWTWGLSTLPPSPTANPSRRPSLLVKLLGGSGVPNGCFPVGKRQATAERKPSGGWSRVHQKAARQRNDFVHKVTTDLVGRFDLICVEDLSVKGMARTKLARSVLDAAFGEFRRQLEYKTLWKLPAIGDGRPVLPEYEAMPRLQLVNNEPTLSDRVWSCGCGEVHRRALSAALNLKAEGMRLVAIRQTETQNARGATRKTWEARQCGIEARITRR